MAGTQIMGSGPPPPPDARPKGPPPPPGGGPPPPPGAPESPAAAEATPAEEVKKIPRPDVGPQTTPDRRLVGELLLQKRRYDPCPTLDKQLGNAALAQFIQKKL